MTVDGVRGAGSGADHCAECKAFADCYLDPDDADRAEIGQWHIDHPDGKISAEEQASMEQYAHETMTSADVRGAAGTGDETALERGRLQDLATYALAGPWTSEVDDHSARVVGPFGPFIWLDKTRDETTSFIAASRSAIPYLLDLVESVARDRARQEAALNAIRELHAGVPGTFTDASYCDEDKQPMPCETVRILDGEK